MIKTGYIIVLLMTISLAGFSQSDYILPGETEQVSAESDTLYVITIGQMRQAVTADKEKELLNREVELLNQKITTLEQKTATLDSLMQTHQEDALFYKDSWKKAEDDLEKALQEARKQRRHKYIYGAGGVLMGLLFSIF